MTRRVAIRSLANGRIVCAENGGNQPLIANRDGIGPWETFEIIELDEGNGMPQPAPPPYVPPPAPSPPDVRPPSGSGGLPDRLVRVTNEQDGEFVPRMYSYWSNAWICPDGVYVFAGHESGESRFFQVAPNGHVARLGPLLPYQGTSEGWYFDAQGWVYLLEGPRMRRVNPFTGEDRVVFSIERTHPGCELWQAHSSDDGQTHSASVVRVVSEGQYPRLGTVVCRGRDQQYYEAQGVLDESHLTGNGRYLTIEERRQDDGNDNRYIDLATGESRWVRDPQGALSHCATGADFIVGEDNFAGACVRLDCATGARRELFHTWGMGHVSIRGDVCLLSDGDALSLVSLHGGSVVSFLRHGMTGGDYDHQVKANLDPSGRIACFMSNRDRGGNSYDVYLAPVPR
jgi:hypothetical protein